MKRNIIETVLGAVVLLVAGIFLIYSTQSSDAGAVEGYDVNVAFNDIGGLQTSDDVRVGGVKVGSVKAIALDPATYRARVTLSIENKVKLPTDTAARVSSQSLMGGNYLALDVGGDEDNIRDGGTIQYSQDAQNLESLLGKFIFSATGEKTDDKEKTAAAPASKAAPATVTDTTITPAEPAREDSSLPKM